MFRLLIENEKKEKIELTNSPFYESVKIEGLLPPQATVNSSAVLNRLFLLRKIDKDCIHISS